MRRLLLWAILAPLGTAAAADFEPPQLIRLDPLGGRAGTAVEVEILGTQLGTATGVDFDCADLEWKQTTLREAGRIKGIVWIEPGAALGPHMLRVLTSSGGPTSSLLFNVGQYAATVESTQRAIAALPAEIYGRLDGAADSDTYWFSVQDGSRWLFDLRAMEHGSAVEARMMLLDGSGKQIAFNDDRDQYNENPLIEHAFATGGVYAVKLDQYRGPRGFTFGKNNGYVLRISSLPRIEGTNPLGGRTGAPMRLTVSGSALETVNGAWLTQARRGEYARMTYPYTMPIRFTPDPPRAANVARIGGAVVSKSATRLELEFSIPPDTAPGVWRLWLASAAGIADGPAIEIATAPEFDEPSARRNTEWPEEFSVNGVLAETRERDTFVLAAHKGVALHLWALGTQLGAPWIDTVLSLRDAAGKVVASNDDVVAGWGGLLGNPDSSVFYTPTEDGRLTVEVRDRQNRGGPAYAYRLRAERRRPGFQLFTTPENFTVRRGETLVAKVHLVREEGFTGEVDITVEGLPPGMGPLRGKFRTDHVFEPNADGADMVIPEIGFRIDGAQAPPGVYRLRIVGKASSAAGGFVSVAEAQTATMIGPIYQGDWNFYRRPVPGITLTVVDAPPAQ